MARTRSNRKNCTGIRSAVAVLRDADVQGVVRFRTVGRNQVEVSYSLTGLSDGLHGFHIHEYGDLSEGCKSACAHFNPQGKTHGGPHDAERHAGDLGNVDARDGVAKGKLVVSGISLNPKSRLSIIGRAVVVHADPDDLGRGGNAESLRTGNAGARIGCAVIGLSSRA